MPKCFSLCILVGLGLAFAARVHAENGVTGDTIVIGQSAALSGPARRLGESMREGALLYFDEINRSGGVYGRKIKLMSVDDGYEPDRAVANTERLIARDKVFALFAYVGTPTSYAVMPMVTSAKIPFFGAFTGAEGLRAPFNKYVFNVRASYYQETEALVNFLVQQQEKKRIAVFYQNDAYGKAGLAGVQLAMERRKLPIAALGTVERNTVDVQEAVKSIGKANPQAVIMISAYTSIAAFVRALRRAGSNAEFLNVSFVGSDALAAELGPEAHGIYVSQVVPYPWDPAVTVAVEFTDLAKRNAPDLKPSFNNLEGYVAAKLFTEGLRRAGANLTRDGFIGALESINSVDMGKFPVSFSPANHNGSNYVGLTVIIGKQGNFIPVLNAPAAPANAQTAAR
jgi:ABC-type branched-subunit amino acid transport system substrate-binding protein